jgi:hypothetical protein
MVSGGVGLRLFSFMSHPLIQLLIWMVFMGMFAAWMVHSRFFQDVTRSTPTATTTNNTTTTTNNNSTTTAASMNDGVARMIRELPVMKVHARVEDLQSFSTSELKDVYRYYHSSSRATTNNNNTSDNDVYSKNTTHHYRDGISWDPCLVEKSEVIQEIERLIALQRHDNSRMCSICYEEYEVGETVRYLPECGHIYHIECIDQWCLTRPSNNNNQSITQVTCPLCKRPIRPS